jgi:hypothetical protein
MIFTAVPIGTPAAVCKAVTCKRRIYWITTGNGKPMPINCDVPGGKLPTGRDPGQGIPHFADCPEAGSFRRAGAS